MCNWWAGIVGLSDSSRLVSSECSINKHYPSNISLADGDALCGHSCPGSRNRSWLPWMIEDPFLVAEMAFERVVAVAAVAAVVELVSVAGLEGFE